MDIEIGESCEDILASQRGLVVGEWRIVYDQAWLNNLKVIRLGWIVGKYAWINSDVLRGRASKDVEYSTTLSMVANKTWRV